MSEFSNCRRLTPIHKDTLPVYDDWQGVLLCKNGKVSWQLTNLQFRVAMIETVKMRRKKGEYPVISIILAVILVNGAYRFYMKLIGADVMVYRKKTKLVWYILASLALFSVLGV